MIHDNSYPGLWLRFVGNVASTFDEKCHMSLTFPPSVHQERDLKGHLRCLKERI